MATGASTETGGQVRINYAAQLIYRADNARKYFRIYVHVCESIASLAFSFGNNACWLLRANDNDSTRRIIQREIIPYADCIYFSVYTITRFHSRKRHAKTSINRRYRGVLISKSVRDILLARKFRFAQKVMDFSSIND